MILLADTRHTAGTKAGLGQWVFHPTVKFYDSNASISVCHNNKGNMSYFDGHAGSIGRPELQEAGFTQINDGSKML